MSSSSFSLRQFIKEFCSFKAGFFLLAIWEGFLLFKQDIHSPRFITTFIAILFVAVTLNLTIYAFLFLFHRKKSFYKLGFYTLLGSSSAIFIALNYPWANAFWGQFMNDVLVKYLWPSRFIQVSIKDGNFFWLLMLSLYVGIFLIIHGNWHVKKLKKDGFWKIDRQVMYLGLGLYAVLTMFIFIFTHFTFVGSNYVYMENSLRYVDKLADYYDFIDMKENFALKDLKYFKSWQEMKDYYANPLFKARLSTAESKEDFYNESMNLINRIKEKGFQPMEPITYEKINRFHEWMEISYNLNLKQANQQEKKLWYSELTPPEVIFKGGEKEVLRHSFLYIKQSKDRGYYSYFILDRTFKDYKMNDIFNIFFILFHLVYIGLFIYLLKIHKKINLSKKPGIIHE